MLIDGKHSAMGRGSRRRDLRLSISPRRSCQGIAIALHPIPGSVAIGIADSTVNIFPRFLFLFTRLFEEAWSIALCDPFERLNEGHLRFHSLLDHCWRSTAIWQSGLLQ